jgi:hypothetical protein
VPADHARYFGHPLGSGNEGAIVTVRAEGREEEVIGIIEAHGGDIGDEADDYDYGTETESPTDA